MGLLIETLRRAAELEASFQSSKQQITWRELRKDCNILHKLLFSSPYRLTFYKNIAYHSFITTLLVLSAVPGSVHR
jgi:hypothetical protein